MNTKTLKFLAVLLLTVAATSVVSYCWRVYVDAAGSPDSIVQKICHGIYSLSPVLAVLFVEKWRVRSLIREYRITLKGVNVKKLAQHILATAVLFPALVVFFTYILGNLCSVSGVGDVPPLTATSNFWGFDLPEGRFLRVTTLLLGIIGVGVFNALIYILYSLGLEVGWRGFLEKNIARSGVKKVLLTGLVWWAWSLPPMFLASKAYVFDFQYGVLFSRLLLYIACSFYFVRVLRQTGTLFAPAIVRGLILYFPFIFLVTGYGFITEILAAASVGLVSLLFHGLEKQTK